MMASLPLIRGPGKGLRGDVRTYPREPLRVCTAHKVCLTRLSTGTKLSRGTEA